MAMIPTRWKCAECDCINGKHPAFKLYLPGRITAVDISHVTDPKAEWKCSLCKHAPRSHKFTFEAPKDDKAR